MGLYAYGTLLAEGRGVSQDAILAHAFLNLAAVRGHPDAARARDAVQLTMTNEEIGEAQAIARTWRSSAEAASEGSEGSSVVPDSNEGDSN